MFTPKRLYVNPVATVVFVASWSWINGDPVAVFVTVRAGVPTTVPVTELDPADVNPPAPIATGPEGLVNVNGARSLNVIANRLFAVILNSQLLEVEAEAV